MGPGITAKTAREVRTAGRGASDEPAAAQRSLGSLIVLLVAACVTEAVLLWLTALMSLPRFFPASNPGKEQVSLDFDSMLGPNWLRNTLLQTAAFAALFLAFLVSLWLIHRAHRPRAMLLIVFIAPLVWTATAAFMYPPYARDLFHNLADARLIWIYHLNPMVVAPVARPFPIHTSFDTQPSAYGPVWYLLTFPAAVFQPHNYLNSIILLKLWMGVFYLGSGFVVYLIARNQWKDRAIFAAALYLWNPFVIIRALGDAHNDVVMFFFVLVALYFAVKQKWLFVLPAMMLSILVKYTSALILPLIGAYVLFLPRTERTRILRPFLAGAAVSVSLAVLLFMPFWIGPQIFKALLGQADLSATSTPRALEFLVTGSILPTSFAPTSRLVMEAVFLVPYIWLVSRVRSPVWRLQTAAYQALLLYLLIAVSWFRPWYLLWVVTIGALLPWGWFLALTLTISWFAMFPEIVDQYAGKVAWLAASDGRMMLATIIETFLPPALLWLVAILRTRSWVFQAAAD